MKRIVCFHSLDSDVDFGATTLTDSPWLISMASRVVVKVVEGLGLGASRGNRVCLYGRVDVCVNAFQLSHVWQSDAIYGYDS